ncbi:MAG: hypothetical protein KDB35_04500, partial [Acidimicrobiales bacterium]|nr:hypothetical protein [Acidimicrobiales bacterium]
MSDLDLRSHADVTESQTAADPEAAPGRPTADPSSVEPSAVAPSEPEAAAGPGDEGPLDPSQAVFELADLAVHYG